MVSIPGFTISGWSLICEIPPIEAFFVEVVICVSCGDTTSFCIDRFQSSMKPGPVLCGGDAYGGAGELDISAALRSKRRDHRCNAKTQHENRNSEMQEEVEAQA
jgi:hypothetical protein